MDHPEVETGPLLFTKDLPHDAPCGPSVEFGIPDRLVENDQLPLLQIRDDIVGVVGSGSARVLVAQGLERENTIRCAEDAEDSLQSRIRPLFPGIRVRCVLLLERAVVAPPVIY